MDVLADELFSVAVIVTLRSDVMAPAVAVKVAVLLPAATVTVVGTVKLLFRELSDTVEPPAGAGPLRFTVHVDDAPGAIDSELQDNELMVGGGGCETVIVPPVEETVWETPAGLAPSAFVMPIVAVAAALVNVILTTPTTPFEILFALTP
jgi:hypothetical protein